MEEHKDYKRLFEFFKSFPGIGKRQAERFVYHVLTKDSSWVDNFTREIQKAKNEVWECSDCFRVFKNQNGLNESKCEICRSNLRDRKVLAVVSQNIDAESFLQKTAWNGLIFVLGGNIPVIERKNRNKVRLEELINYVKKLSGGESPLEEVVICNSLNPDGIFTASVIHQKLRELNVKNLKITTFGRGFSTGTELEYADKETLLNALKNRSENVF